MKADWVLIDDYIALKTASGSIIVPSGVDIFQAQYRERLTILNQDIVKPSAAFPDIAFSKYPVKLQIKVKPSTNSEALMYFELCGIYGNQIVATVKEPLNRIANHVVANGTWYAFEPGSFEEIKSFMMKEKISSHGELTLQQLFKLLTNPLESVELSLALDLNSIPDLTSFENVPNCFEGKLYPYQNTGYRWLCMIYKEGLGCILGDEMGLGKTVQIICLIARNIEKGLKPSLVVAPATLLENWRREFAKFTPSVSTYIHIGNERTGLSSTLERFGVVITSYSTLIRDASLLKMVKWDLIVTDEAQAIKNPEADRTKVVKQLPRKTAIAVSGTPVQNKLIDLWSIMDFVIPGLLGDKTSFEYRYANDVNNAANLEPIVRPVILRRTITEVAKDLPPKIIIPQPIEMTQEIATMYETCRREIIEKYGSGAQLVNLQKLRMFCTHPFLTSPQGGDPAAASPKYLRLLEIVEEIVSNNEQVLIFTSFTDMIDLMLEDFPKRFAGIWINWIDGRVPIDLRQPRVDEFNSCEKPAVLILNPQAAGTGLNLTAANHVIHYNLEWNPAVEDQASARAHRIGQKKPVTIHRLYYMNSVEEVINDRLEFKRDLAETTVKGVKGEVTEYSEVWRALKVSPVIKETS